MMIGGEAAVLEQARPVLEAVGSRITHMGPVGAGQATKAVNQIMAAGINQAVTEALAFGAAHGLPMDRVIEVVGSGAAGNWFLTHRGPSMVEGRFEPGFRVALHHKDLMICRQMAGQLGVAMPVVEMTLVHYRRLMEAGLGDEDISALFREKRALFGPDDSRPALDFPGAWLAVGEQQIHLIEIPEHIPQGPVVAHGGRDRHFALQVTELEPVQERAAEFEQDPARVRAIINEGSEAARDLARETLEEVRAAMGLAYT